MRFSVALALSVAATACDPRPCASWLEPTHEPITGADLALPIVARIEDRGRISRSNDGCEYGNELRRGALGPFEVEYDVWDYKGQPVTTGTGARIFDPACPSRSVEVHMHATVTGVVLRYDAARDVYILDTQGNGGDRAIAVRRVRSR